MTVTTAKKFALDIGWVFISQIITFVTGFFLSVILGKFLGAAPFGLYSMTLTIYAIVALVGGIGIPTAIVKYVAESKQDKDKLNIFVSCGIINSLVFGVITGLVLFAISGMFASIFNMPELTDLIKIIAFSLPFLAVNNALLGVLNGLREMKLYSFRTIVRSILLLGFTTLLVGIGFGVKGAVFSLLLSEIGTLFLLILYSKDFFKFIIKDYFENTKEMLKFGSQLFIASAVWMVNTNVDKLLVGYFLLAKDVGIYTIALAISSGLLMIPGAISTVTFPAISEYNFKGQHDAIEMLINRSMKYSLVILSILGICIIFFSEDIILLGLRPEFLPAVTPMTILVLAIIFFGSVASVGAAFSALGRPDIQVKQNAPLVIVNVIIDIILIPVLGIIGAAIGTATSFLSLIIMEFYFYNKLNIKINYRIFIKIFIFIVPIIVLFYVFRQQINIYLLIFILVGLYAILITKFILTKEDLNEVIKSIGIRPN